MKSFMFVALAVSTLAMTGCAGACPTPASPHVADATLPPPDKCEHRPCPDSFDAAGNLVAVTGRYVYDTSKKAVVWLTSDEAQARYRDAWAAAKATAQHAYEVANDAYQAHQ